MDWKIIVTDPLNTRRQLLIGMCVLTLAACLGGCMSRGDTPATVTTSSDRARNARYVAEVSEGTGKIIFPVDRYEMTQEEQLLEKSAQYLDLALCMHKQGMPAYWSPEATVMRDENTRYGRWVMKNAEEFAYTRIPNKVLDDAFIVDDLFRKKFHDVIDSKEYTDAQEHCLNNPAEDLIMAESLTFPNEVSRIGQESYDLMLSSEEAHQVFADWERCLNDEGLSRDPDDPYSILGVDYSRVDENTIRIAVQDVRCKQTTNFVQRLADIEASFQGPVVERYESELAAYSESIEKIVDNRKKFLADHAHEAAELWVPKS